MALPNDIVLEARGITKAFPGVRALDGVDLQLRRGRLTALVGENGAGKSTLMNILAGVFAPDAGELFLDGRAVHFAGAREAREHGIATIFQELSLVPNLTVAENIFLGCEPRTAFGLIDYAAMHREARALLRRVALPVAPDVPVHTLRVGQQQLVEIARALAREARVVIFDEPTSALSDHEIDVLFNLIADLKQRGVALVYITHKFEELARAADDVSVMRDGRVVGAAPLAELSRDRMVQLMVGRELNATAAKATAQRGAEVLRVENLSLRHAQRAGEFVVRQMNLHVCRGEVLGIFGLMGAGRTELLEALFGLHPTRTEGRVRIEGEALEICSPVDAIRCGLALAPEDRKHDGLVLEMTVKENASLACLERAERFGLIDRQRETALVSPLIQRFRVKTPSLNQAIRNLSGGNQQKVILAKWLATNPRVLLLDEPTRGIDIHAKQEIYTLIDELARAGLAVIVVSSELPEVLALSDRLLVMCQGRQTAEFARGEATPEAVVRAALPQAA